MKNFLLRYFFITGIILISQVNAQITITATDYSNRYAVGKGLKGITNNTDTASYSMNVGVASAVQAQTWSMPNAKLTDTSGFTNVVPSSTLYFNKFPMATHSSISSSGTPTFSFTFTSYIRIANDSVILLGVAIRQKSAAKDTTTFDMVPKGLIKFPFNVGTTLATTRDSTNYGSGNYAIRTSAVTIDAYGTITLPNGTFQCLRQKAIQISELYFGATVTKDTMTSFNWMTKEGHGVFVFLKKNGQSSGNIQVKNINYSLIIDVPLSVSNQKNFQPNSFALLQNYPNPFNPSTVISYQLSANSFTTLKAYDALGREITTLVNEVKEAGSYSATFNAANLPSGVYFYRLNASGKIQTGRMNLIK